MGIEPSVEAKDVPRILRELPEEAWTTDLVMLHNELAAVRLELASDEPLISVGALSAEDPGDDVGVRKSALDAMAQTVRAGAGGGIKSTSGSTAEGPVPESALKTELPRVEPPEVEDEPGQAIKENTPGYIAQAFPKLFPHGIGDFHSLRAVGRQALKFEEWGRMLMMWHDGRFMRHTRFRYWLLDTSLRSMTPSMQRVFFRTREAATDYTLEDLRNKEVCQNLVGQMSTATSKLPGSIGERRSMRQELEAMVHQIEAETADAGENGGQGRVPAGFCTLTTAVYKWDQLYELLLLTYPTAARDSYTGCKGLSSGSDKEKAKKE